MKLVLYDDYKPGLIRDDQVIDVTDIVGMQGRGGQETMAAIITDYERLQPEFERRLGQAQGVPLVGVQLQAPLPRPGKVIAMGANYLESTGGTPLPILVFLKSNAAVTGPDSTVTLPPINFVICHHEAELVLVLGKEGKDVPESNYMDYIFGYTCGIDVSARGDYGGHRFMGKSFDGFAPLGPCIVTKDEIPDHDNLQVRFWVDGQPRHNFNTSDMGHKIPECIAYVTTIMTIKPGDVLFTGTNHEGIGPLQDGETGDIEIERVGRFSIKISDPKQRSWPKEIDKGMGTFVRDAILKGSVGATINYQAVSGQ